MTMIAYTSNFGYPIIVGDLLVSSQQKGSRFILPSRPADIIQDLPEDTKLYPSKLFQKIYIIKDYLCIGFAGSLFEIKRTYTDFVQYCRYFENVKEEDVIRFAEQNSLNDRDDLSVLVVFAYKTEKRPTFHKMTFGHWKTEQVQACGEVVITGSGADNFLNEARGLHFGNNHKMPPQISAVTNIAGLLGHLLTKESIYLETIGNHYGFGFEMIYFNGQRFEKLSDFVFAILYQHSSSTESVKTSCIIHYKYDNDILLITYVYPDNSSFRKKHGKIVFSSNQIRQSRVIITPVDVIPSEFNSDKYSGDWSFDVGNVSISFIYYGPHGPYAPTAVGNRNVARISYKKGKSLKIHLKKLFFDSIIHAAKTGYQKVHNKFP